MFIKQDKRKTSDGKDALEMKDIAELETDRDVVEWCRDFFAITNASCPQYERETRADRNFLMALVGYLREWCLHSDCTLDGLLTLLSMAEGHAYDESYISPLDILFKNIERGESYEYVPQLRRWRHRRYFACRNSDGVMPAERGGLSADEDFALLCYHSVKYLPSNQRITIAANLTSRVIDFKYLHGSIDFKPRHASSRAVLRSHTENRTVGAPVE